MTDVERGLYALAMAREGMGVDDMVAQTGVSRAVAKGLMWVYGAGRRCEVHGYPLVGASRLCMQCAAERSRARYQAHKAERARLRAAARVE